MEDVLSAGQLMLFPVLTREKFAQQVGVSAGVVQGWIDKGYLPTFEIGKYRLVNVAVLTRRAMEKVY